MAGMATEGNLSAEYARIIHKASKWWAEPAFRPRRLSRVIWGEKDLSDGATEIRIEDDDLVLELVTSTTGALLQNRDHFDALSMQSIEGVAADDWTFRAERAGVTQTSVSTKPVAEGHEGVQTRTVRVWDWVLKAPGGASRFWLGELRGRLRVYLGNLTLSADGELGGSVSRGHYLLRGPGCEYAIVQRGSSKDRWLLIVHEREPNALTHAALRRDMNALAISLGAPVSVTRLLSVDEQLRVQGIIGSEFGVEGEQRFSEQTLVPSTNDLNALPAPFFETLAAFLAKESADRTAPVVQSGWYYLESIAERTAPSTLLKIALAAVVVARDLLDQDDALVRDTTAFAAWITAAKEDLARLARDGCQALLEQRLAGSANAGPIDVVRLALARAQLAVPAPLDDALKTAEHVVAGGRTPTKGFYETYARLRVIFAALLARTIGYRGPLAGWTRAGAYSFYHHAPSDWWPADDSVAAEYFIAKVEGEFVGDLAELWPSVDAPTVPKTGLIGVLAQYAAGLATASTGNAYAELRPLPRRDHREDRRYELAMHATQHPTTKITLFVARPSEDKVRIEGWHEDVELSSVPETLAFLERLGSSPETSAAVERLLLASQEAQRRGES